MTERDFIIGMNRASRDKPSYAACDQDMIFYTLNYWSNLFTEAWIQKGKLVQDPNFNMFTNGTETKDQEEKVSDEIYKHKPLVSFKCAGWECVWLNDEEIFVGGCVLGVESTIEALAKYVKVG